MAIQLISSLGSYMPPSDPGYRDSSSMDLVPGENRLLVYVVGGTQDPPILTSTATIRGHEIEPAAYVQSSEDPMTSLLVYLVYEDVLSQITDPTVNIRLPEGSTAWSGAAAIGALYSGVAQEPPEWSAPKDEYGNTFIFGPPDSRTAGSLLLAAVAAGTASRYNPRPINGAEIMGVGGFPDDGWTRASLSYRTDAIDTIEVGLGLPQDQVALAGWAASFRAEGTGPGIHKVGDDDTVADGESGVLVTGSNLPTSGAVSIRSDAISQAQTASARTPESFTLGPVARGSLPYSDGFHDHELVVAASPEDMTRAVAFKPAAGFAAYPLHPGYANQTPGESVLSSAGTITEGMQLKVPLDFSGVPIEWELMAGFATGRIASLGTVIEDSVELPGVELFGGSGWDDIPVTMQPDGSVGPVPDPFVFSPVTGAEPATQYESNAITIAGIPDGTSVPVSVYGGQYSVSTDGGTTWGAWTVTSATVQLGYQIRVRGISSATSSMTTSVTLNAGGRIGTFSITTKAADEELPDPFEFADRNGASLSTLYESNAITVTGISPGVAIPLMSVYGEHSVSSDGGKTWSGWSDGEGSVRLGDQVKVRGQSSNEYGGETVVWLGINGTVGSFTIRTREAPSPPTPGGDTAGFIRNLLRSLLRGG